MEISVKWIAIGILCFKISLATCLYPEYVVEDLCKFGNETIVYESSKTGLAGTITATSHPSYRPNKNCTLIIKPPIGKGVVVSLRKIDLRERRFTCQDYIKIYHSDVFTSPSTICHFMFDLNEKVSFYSNGPMKILYHVDSNLFTRIGFEQGFTITFTIVSEETEDCMQSDVFVCENGRCISKSLTCDSRNNCGDRSDEDPAMCESKIFSYFHVTELMYVIVFSLFILIIVITCAVVVTRRRRRSDDTDSVSDLDEPTARLTPYQAVHPTGFFICQNPAGPDNLFPQHSKIVQSEGGFSNPCYPTGIPMAPPPYSQ